MKITALALILVISAILIGCCSAKRAKKDAMIREKINECSMKWIYQELRDTISIKLILLDKKGQYDMISWPNLFIGVDKNNDTVGVIDNFSIEIFKAGEILKFEPYYYGPPIEKIFFLQPIFSRHKKKQNNIYCRVSNIYYGKLKK